MKLTILNSRRNIRGEWLLVDGGQYTVGRQTARDKLPEVNLSFDRQVNHRHCLIFGEHGKWWIENLRSKQGAQVRRSVNPEEWCAVACGEPMRIWPGDEILIGSTTLVLEPHHRHRAWFGELVLEVDLVPAINYSLIHCGLPILVRLAVRNYGRARSLPVKLSIQLLGHGLPNDLFIPAIAPEGQYILSSPRLIFQTDEIERLCERKLAQVCFSIDDTPILEPTIWLLAYNEWSQERNHRLTLASFVQPNHPFIRQVETEARMILNTMTEGEFDSFEVILQSDRADRIELIMRAFYAYFQEQWHLNYCAQPPCYEANSQKLRMPHHVLLDFATRRGEGTCMDFALLFAACLEYLGLRPMLILTMGESRWHHAAIGCMRSSRGENNPILLHKEKLMTDAILCEVTGVAKGRNNGEGCEKYDFVEACQEASQCMAGNRFLYAIDVVTTRREPWKVTPLPEVGEPVLDPEVREILRTATGFARTFASDYIGTLHLLLALVSQPEGWMRRVLDVLRISAKQADAILKQELGQSGKISQEKPQSTPHYDQIIATMQVLAKRDRSPLVKEAHVITALLESQSELVDRALQKLGVGRAMVKKSFAEVYVRKFKVAPQGLYWE